MFAALMTAPALGLLLEEGRGGGRRSPPARGAEVVQALLDLGHVQRLGDGRDIFAAIGAGVCGGATMANQLEATKPG